jgi:hypothetical protein
MLIHVLGYGRVQHVLHVLGLRSSLVSVPGITEESALMKMCLKWASVIGRSGVRMAESPTRNIYSNVIIKYLDNRTKCSNYVKVNLSVLKLRVTPWRHIGGVNIWPHVFLTSALDGSERSASRPGRFTPRERVHGTHWIRCWATVGLDVMVKSEIPVRKGNRTSVLHPVA